MKRKNPPFNPNANSYPYRRWSKKEIAAVFERALREGLSYHDIREMTGLTVSHLYTARYQAVKEGLLPAGFALSVGGRGKEKEYIFAGIISDYLFGEVSPLDIALGRELSCDDVCRFLKTCGFDPDPHAARPALPESE